MPPHFQDADFPLLAYIAVPAEFFQWIALILASQPLRGDRDDSIHAGGHV